MHRFPPVWLQDSKCGRLWSDITQRGAIRGAAVRRTVLKEQQSAPAGFDVPILRTLWTLHLQGTAISVLGTCSWNPPYRVGGGRDVSPQFIWMPSTASARASRPSLPGAACFSAPYRNITICITAFHPIAAPRGRCRVGPGRPCLPNALSDLV